MMELSLDKPEAVLVKCEIDPLDMEVVRSQDVKVEPEDGNGAVDDDDEDVVNGEAAEESEKLAKNFSCQICEKTFTRNSNLKAHMRQVHKNEVEKDDNKPFGCHQCKSNFSSESALSRHGKRAHADVRVRKQSKRVKEATKTTTTASTVAPPPPTTTTTTDEFDEDEDLKNELSDCIICPKIFELNELLQNVMRDDLDKIEPYHCVACGKQYNWELDGTDADLNFIDDDDPESTPLDTLDLAEQIEDEAELYEENDNDDNYTNGKPARKKSSKLDRNHACNICQKTFSKRSYVKEHVRRVHENPEPIEVTPFQCHVCEKYFSDKSALIRHIRLQHEEPKVLYECDLCHEKFVNTRLLEKHTNRIHTKLKPFHCDVCNLDFIEKRQLVRHNRMVHNEVIVFPCKLCKEEFSSRKTLRLHMTSSHKNFAQNQCEICEKKYTTPTALWRHIDQVHQKLQPFQCEQCGKNFSRQEFLKSHQFVHENQKPFQCHICGTGFPAQNRLDFHIARHFKDSAPIYECKLCKKEFILRKTYVEHLRSVHNAEPEKMDPIKRKKSEEKFLCELCSKTFTRQRYLKKHKETVHERTNF